MALWFNKHLNKLMYTSGALLVIGLVFLVMGDSAIRDITFILAALVAIGPILQRAWSALTVRSFSIELLPDEKMAYIENEQNNKRKVMMVGDGFNDAPALGLSDVGVAIGHGGTDIAMETADVVLMSDKLKKLAIGYTMSKSTFNIMMQNTGIALITVVLLLLGVVYGYIHLASGMLIHQASVLAVIMNAMRLMPMNRKDNEEEISVKEAAAS